ncbi:MAG: type II toxin-antitoxin system YoeB family toxin [Bacteroidota bacterium]
MQLIGNELSFHFSEGHPHVVEQSFVTLFKTFKKAKEKYGFSHIRFPENYSQLKITPDQTLIEWILNISNPILKNLVLDLFKAPYTDNLENEELEEFVNSKYEIVWDNVLTNQSPFGLPIAHIKATPSISINSHDFWQNRKITIKKTSENNAENTKFVVYNICREEDINSFELKEWAHNFLSIQIYSEENLEKYLSYAKYKVQFDDRFMQHFLEWKSDDIERYKYLLLLMKDVELHPFTGGMGKTENLKNRGKEASKRITRSDRLSYQIENNIVTFLACKGHYDFH